MAVNVHAYDENHCFDIVSVSYIGCPKPNTAMYISKKVDSLLRNLHGVGQCLVFIENTIPIPEELRKENCFIQVDNPQLAYARFLRKHADDLQHNRRRNLFELTPEGYYLGENVTIGRNAWIEPACVIGPDVSIGDNAKVFAGTKIRNATIGDDFTAGENCVIGSCGFTMAVDENGNRLRIPTMGRVQIGNSVEIGALCNISVGTAEDTILGDYTKMDALVYVGHDARLGVNGLVPAGVIIGGYADVGENAHIGFNATLRNRIVIGANATIGMGAVVTKDIPCGETVVGNPAKPLVKNRDMP